MSRSTRSLRNNRWKFALLLWTALLCGTAGSAAANEATELEFSSLKIEPATTAESSPRIKPATKTGPATITASNTTLTEATTCWAYLRWPKLTNAVASLCESGDAARVAAGQFLDSFHSAMGQSVATTSTACLTLVGRSCEVIGAVLPATETSAQQIPQFAQLDSKSAYWHYYNDCDRWGIELTRQLQAPAITITIRTQQESPAAAEQTAAPDLVSDRASDHTPNRTSAENVRWLPSLQLAKAWLSDAWQRLEFASIETSVYVGLPLEGRGY